ncbi:histidinol-phosphatase [Maricaulis parjimensis]|uniref:histidinol-phosphatase n=1 Tax=Maricaulis parjimensis TaxID=144023 RepID=UPI00193AD54B|nr:histidinol-phosphatase [Maricaulis parjimensis]
MTRYDLSDDLKLAHALADAARAAIRPFFRTGTSIDNKLETGFDPVTAADRASEQAMRALLAEHRPEDGIVGEEFGDVAGRSGRRWVLDPIDGTRAFISGLPSWTVLIALEVEDRPQIGIIDQPHLGERFAGTRDGTRLHHAGTVRDLAVREGVSLGSAILSSTDPYLFEGAEADAFAAVRERVRLTRYGFDAYAYAMLAAGGIDLVIESGLQIYDVQAFIPVIEGAGGIVTNWDGGDPSQGGQVVAAASRDLLEAALECLRPAAV